MLSAPKRGLAEKPRPGTYVRLTGYFLRATGQLTGGDAVSKWMVIPCSCSLCESGDYLAVEEITEYGTARHFALGNLEEVGKLPKAADMADAVPVTPYTGLPFKSVAMHAKATRKTGKCRRCKLSQVVSSDHDKACTWHPSRRKR